MSDLVAFLNARYDEEAAEAKAATPGPWMLRDGRDWLADNVIFGEGSWPGHIQQAANVEYAEHKEGNARHIARHDPARVLREVEAKRKILHRCTVRMNEPDRYPNGLVSPRAVLARQIVAEMAAVYSDHDDYRPEWA